MIVDELSVSPNDANEPWRVSAVAVALCDVDVELVVRRRRVLDEAMLLLLDTVLEFAPAPLDVLQLAAISGLARPVARAALEEALELDLVELDDETGAARVSPHVIRDIDSVTVGERRLEPALFVGGHPAAMDARRLEIFRRLPALSETDEKPPAIELTLARTVWGDEVIAARVVRHGKLRRLAAHTRAGAAPLWFASEGGTHHLPIPESHPELARICHVADRMRRQTTSAFAGMGHASVNDKGLVVLAMSAEQWIAWVDRGGGIRSRASVGDEQMIVEVAVDVRPAGPDAAVRMYTDALIEALDALPMDRPVDTDATAAGLQHAAWGVTNVPTLDRRELIAASWHRRRYALCYRLSAMDDGLE